MERHIFYVKLSYGYSSGTLFECHVVATTAEKAMERARTVLNKVKGKYNTVEVVFVERHHKVYV